MARSLDQIIQELDAGYAPQRQLINEKIAGLPAQADAEISGLNATKDLAYNDIVAGARDRGMGFSGIPLGEQAKYSATQFLPAVARVRQSQNDLHSSLLGNLNELGSEQRKYATTIQQGELQADEQRRQFEAQLAAQREEAARARAAAGGGSLSSLLGGGGLGGGAARGPAPTMAKKASGGGFAFTDTAGNPISAAKYAQLTGTDISELFKYMGQQGDAYAANAYNWLQKTKGMDQVNTPQKLYALASKNLSPLFWGL